MKAVASQYDLTSGRKLFEPKIQGSTKSLLSNISSAKLLNTPPSKKSIKHTNDDYEESPSASRKNLNS